MRREKFFIKKRRGENRILKCSSVRGFERPGNVTTEWFANAMCNAVVGIWLCENQIKKVNYEGSTVIGSNEKTNTSPIFLSLPCSSMKVWRKQKSRAPSKYKERKKSIFFLLLPTRPFGEVHHLLARLGKYITYSPVWGSTLPTRPFGEVQKRVIPIMQRWKRCPFC